MNDFPVTVRLCAAESDRAAALQIRFAVFVEEQKVPADEEIDDYDSDALHLVAVADEDKAIIGTLRIVDKGEGIAKIGRVAVLSAYRGRGVGHTLMRQALSEARKTGATFVLLDAQVFVIPFYARLGFVAEGPVFDDAGIPHRRMTLALPPRSTAP